MRSIKKFTLVLLASIFCICLLSFVTAAQSTDQNFPTAVTTNEINGTIRARDIGDSRLTSYFYAFDGVQGDIFINVVTKNFTGDIDVFALEGLRPLTKMVVYADGSTNETGRLVYMRKPERLILRIEGRSPNDDPATFKIKFAGSFVALAERKMQDAPAIKGSEVVAESRVRVNSVGTIVEVLPKPLPSPKEAPDSRGSVPSAVARNKKLESETKVQLPTKPAAKKENKNNPNDSKVPGKKPETAPQPVKTPAANTTAKVEKKDVSPASEQKKKTEGPPVNTVFKKTPKPAKPGSADENKSKEAEKRPESSEKGKPDPMAGIRLVIQMKDGKVIERPMNEITKFSVDNGVLTVIAKDGKTVRYSILDVSKVTIE